MPPHSQEPLESGGARRGKALWPTAVLIALLTIGAIYFAFSWDRESRDPVQALRGARSLPKSSLDHPFEFIRELAKAAYEGDGEAQYRIARELDRCEATLTLVRNVSDPEAAIWNLPAGWTQSMKERAFAEYRRCSRLLREDPFADFPRRSGGYTVAYWMSPAAESGHPLALVGKAMSALPAAAGKPDEAERLRKEAREMLVKAMLSGNPDAPLLMGFMMRASANDHERELQGAAWMLAACRAGADCGFDSAVVPFWMCYDGGDV